MIRALMAMFILAAVLALCACGDRPSLPPPPKVDLPPAISVPVPVYVPPEKSSPCPFPAPPLSPITTDVEAANAADAVKVWGICNANRLRAIAGTYSDPAGFAQPRPAAPTGVAANPAAPADPPFHP